MAAESSSIVEAKANRPSGSGIRRVEREAARREAGERRREAWQRRLLPLMGTLLVGAAVFFAVMSVVELRGFYARVEHQPLALDGTFEAFEKVAGPARVGDPAYLRFKIAALLESDALHRRYHQATATMLARVWTRQLGFLTGMLLAVVGAAFILGRLQEEPTRLETEGEGFKAAIATSSPGLVLSTLGAILMAITLVVPFGVETRDVATYLEPGVGRLPPPPSIATFREDERARPGTTPEDPGRAPNAGPPPGDPGPAPGGAAAAKQ